MEIFDESKIKHSFLEISEFAVLFPKHRVSYIKSIEKYMKKVLEDKKIDFETDWENLTMYVRTNNKTRDPYMIIKANELIQLVSKGMLLQDSISILEDGVFSEIIQLQPLASGKKSFENRRKRLANPKVIKALELLTKTKILVSNKNVCVVGNTKGIDIVADVVVKCFNNIHPAYEIKALIVKNNLLFENVSGSWEKFIPKVEKGKQQRKFH
ncbi:dbe [Nucleospora cyclopteri]